MSTTPKDKAKEIYLAHWNELGGWMSDTYKTPIARKMSIVTVNEILKGDHLIRTPLSFWQKVKNEINLL